MITENFGGESPAGAFKPTTLIRQMVLAGVVTTGTLNVWAANDSSSDSSGTSASQQEVIEQLQRRIAVLERKQELQTEEAEKVAQTAPVINIDQKGLKIQSAKGDYNLRIGGLLQADYRYFIDDKYLQNNKDVSIPDGFLIRRLQLNFTGALGKYVDYRVTPEFKGSNGQGDTVELADGWVDLKFSPYAIVRAGKQKLPLSFERFQSSFATAFNELGYAAELAPNRDVGLELYGSAADTKVNYFFGVFNGAPDGRDKSTWDNGRADLVGRLWFSPFADLFNPFRGLSFGVAGSYTKNDQNVNKNPLIATDDGTQLPKYRSLGQQTIFQYDNPSSPSASNPAIYPGKHTRFIPQFAYYWNRFGLTGEYAISDQVLTKGGINTGVKNKAYTVNASWLITGEDAVNGLIRPVKPFVPGAEGWGAFEVVGRVTGLKIDDDAFTKYKNQYSLANPYTAISKAQGWGLGLNWWLNQNLKLTADYDYTRFTGGNSSGPLTKPISLTNRNSEQTLFTRLTVLF